MKKKNRLLLLAILLLGVGFATISTTLKVTGNVKIATNNADFNVIFTKAVLDETDISSTAIIDDGKKITFDTKDLVTVGDVSKLDFEVTNNSTLYDANVSIECTAAGDKSSYYEITKEVASPIPGKRTDSGYIQVKLIMTSEEDFTETFTCTLNTAARERTEKAESPEPLPVKYIPKYFALGTPTIESTQDYKALTYPSGAKADQEAKIFVGLDDDGQKSVCSLATGSLECFKPNNREEEKNHLTEVFNEATCSSSRGDYQCWVGNYCCSINADGGVYCNDNDASMYCHVSFDGNATCRSM